jgi:amino acid efflux transporter
MSIQGFKKSITWLEGSAMTIAAVIGSGILILPGLAAQMAGPASLVSWVAMAILMIPMALTLGMMATQIPDAGGIAAYTRKGFGPTAAAVTGWLYLGTVPIGAPIAALIGVSYISTVVSLTRAEAFLIAILMILLSVLFNVRGIQFAGWIQTAIVLSIILLLTFAMIAAFPHTEGEAFEPFAPNGYVPIGVVMTVLFWAFIGWEMMGHLTEEFRNPKRDIMITTWVSILFVNFLYLGVAWVTVGTGAYVGSGGLASLAKLIGFGWGERAGGMVAVVAFLLSFGSIHTYIAGFTRLVYSQSINGDFPRVFGKLHEKYQTPHRALYAFAVFAVSLLLISYGMGFNLPDLIQWPSAVFIAIYMVGMGAGIALAKTRMLKWLATISLLLCLAIFPFNGWVSLFPIGLALMGFVFHKRKERALASKACITE